MVKMKEERFLVQTFLFHLCWVQQCVVVWLLFDHWTPTTVVASSRPEWYFTETQTYIFLLPHFNCTPSSIVTPAIFPQAWIYQNLLCVCVLDVYIWLFVCVCVSLCLFVWPLGFGCHSIINHQA